MKKKSMSELTNSLSRNSALLLTKFSGILSEFDKKDFEPAEYLTIVNASIAGLIYSVAIGFDLTFEQEIEFLKSGKKLIDNLEELNKDILNEKSTH